MNVPVPVLSKECVALQFNVKPLVVYYCVFIWFQGGLMSDSLGFF